MTLGHRKKKKECKTFKRAEGVRARARNAPLELYEKKTKKKWGRIRWRRSK